MDFGNYIDNDADLQSQMIQDLKDIIDEVSVLLLTDLREKIKEEVYGAGTPSAYSRNKLDGGLEGSFDVSDVEALGLTIQSIISQDPLTMVHDPAHFIHGSNYWEFGNDVRDILSDMIINGNTGTPHVGGIFGEGFWTEPRNFWKPFLEILDKNGNHYIEEAFQARGIQYTIG